ncbi:helix-turn-helix domain-containing protein, partial [Desulfovibrio sp. 1214_IL3152]|uniref:helix-turn-helix domain-containing protein n=1 Tax=Desulfovibrio sp. 1214_IL3152 TaxID=3084056 RepID=UPI002FDAC4B8
MHCRRQACRSGSLTAFQTETGPRISGASRGRRTAHPPGKPCRPTRYSMPEETDFTKTLHRLMQAMNASNDAELARALGITPQSISGARKRGEAPPAWIQA